MYLRKIPCLLDFLWFELVGFVFPYISSIAKKSNPASRSWTRVYPTIWDNHKACHWGCCTPTPQNVNHVLSLNYTNKCIKMQGCTRWNVSSMYIMSRYIHIICTWIFNMCYSLLFLFRACFCFSPGNTTFGDFKCSLLFCSILPFLKYLCSAFNMDPHCGHSQLAIS